MQVQRRSVLSMASTAVALTITCITALAQPSKVSDCLGVLKSQDYYSYATKNHLEVDFIRSIDFETYQQMKTDNKLSILASVSGGLFSLTDDYSTFNEKRQKYLDNQHYHRTESQATDILQITTSPRAYDAYGQCLQHLSQQGVLAWAAKEDSDTIELHVKYSNPAGIAKMQMTGLVSGGAVKGAPRGQLWGNGTEWGVNQEKVFTIERAKGNAQTTVIIQPADGSRPFTNTFYRADGALTLDFVGGTEVLRNRDKSTAGGTPNNDHNRGSCPGQVGHQDGRWCISRTSVTLAAASPRVLRNVRSRCDGSACPWAALSPVSVTQEGHSASVYIDNWGSAVTVVLLADEYENLTKSQCGGDGPIPVVVNQSVAFTSSKECTAIAVIRWRSLRDGSEGVTKFGDATPDQSAIRLESKIDVGDSTVATYKLRL